MKKTSITEAKNQLSALIDRVREGETIWISDRGRPVARLGPIEPQKGLDPEGYLGRLERAGILRKGSVQPPLALIRQAAPRIKAGRSITQIVLEERSEDR